MWEAFERFGVKDFHIFYRYFPLNVQAFMFINGHLLSLTIANKTYVQAFENHKALLDHFRHVHKRGAQALVWDLPGKTEDRLSG